MGSINNNGKQLDLFCNVQAKDIQTPDFDCNGVDRNEAPEGFFAQLKVYKGYNICRDCDARKLCQEDKDDWVLKNRCVSYEIVAFKDGKTYGRKDGKDVVFKRLLA